MLTIVTALHNDWFDFDQMVRHLHEHNNAADFEICVFHDDREQDGSADRLTVLKSEFSNIKSVSHDKTVTIAWVRSILSTREGTWDADVLTELNNNLDKYEAGTLLDSTKELLVLDETARYQAAVDLATVDTPLLFLPQGCLLGCSVSDLEQYVTDNLQQGGHFYSRLNEVYMQATNLGLDSITKAQKELEGLGTTYLSSHAGLLDDEDYELRRDYCHWTTDLSKYFLVDPEGRSPVAFNDTDFLSKVGTICNEIVTSGKLPFEWASNKNHLMSRATYNTLGGFYQSVYEVSGSDWKMEEDARPYFVQELPAQFVLINMSPHKVYDLSIEDAIKVSLAIDPSAYSHPLPGVSKYRNLSKDRSKEYYIYTAVKQDLGIS